MKKGTKYFYSHQDYACHQASLVYHLIVLQCNNVREIIDDQIIQRRQVERKYLLDVIKCLRFLPLQGVSLRGLDNNDNLTQILYFLGTKDDNITKHFQGQLGHKYAYHDIQNKLLHIMASTVLRVRVPTINERKFFLMMADEVG